VPQTKRASWKIEITQFKGDDLAWASQRPGDRCGRVAKTRTSGVLQFDG
jgi:hypothetical protein